MAAARNTEGPVFRPVNKAYMVGSTMLEGGEVPRILKRRAGGAGSHDYRQAFSAVGIAEDLVSIDADLPAVCWAGKSLTLPAGLLRRGLLAKRSAVRTRLKILRILPHDVTRNVACSVIQVPVKSNPTIFVLTAL
jgi:hypothetical protein